ncbi:MAG: hypothetical protein NUW01_05325 [Gemmatimonadaceae bacterium]|nr:hypothetical protein [Gemmatimonadaceae bacterium]
MRRDILLLLGAVIIASAAGYTYLNYDNLQLSAGVIFIGTFLLSWAAPKKFLVFALMIGSSVLLANIYASTNRLDVPAPPGGIAEALLAFIPAVVAGIGGMIIGGGVSNLPDKLGPPADAARVASLEATADLSSGAEPYDPTRQPAAGKKATQPASGPLSGPENTPGQKPRPFA